MSEMTHMQWAKKRALDYLPDIPSAISSFESDLGKHPETEKLLLHVLFFGMGSHITVESVRSFIEGFNDNLGRD
tara:strand:+ start:3017 stop:3238 length:222 start_codon:yes stop_codon:yes gene_type:complete